MAIPTSKGNIQPKHGYLWDDANGTWIAAAGSATGASTVTIAAVSDTPEFFEDTSFVTGDSPVTLDINAALGRNATSTLILNDGPGDFTYAVSTDGIAFGDEITLKQREFKQYVDVSIDSIRITWVADSAYRVEAI